jgi:hypothetical protein
LRWKWGSEKIFPFPSWFSANLFEADCSIVIW